MANGFNIQFPETGAVALQKSIGSLGQFGQQQQALQLAEQKRQQQLSDAIALAEATQQARQKFAVADPLKTAQAQFLQQMIGGQQLGQAPQQIPAQQPSQPAQQPGQALAPQFGGFRPESIKVGGVTFKDPKQQAQTAVLKKQELQKVTGLPGETAGKLTMLQQAQSDIEDVEKLLFSKEGKLKRGLAFASNIPGGRAPLIGRLIPDVGFGTEPRQVNSKINNALEAKLRIETGAAATQEEFDRLQTRFGITGFDTSASAKDKLKRLKQFFDNAVVTIDPTGRFTYQTGDKKLDTQLNTPVNLELDTQVNSLLDQLGAK